MITRHFWMIIEYKISFIGRGDDVKKYPVTSPRGNQYLIKVRRVDFLGNKITMKKKWFKNIFRTVHFTYTETYDCSNILNEIKDTVFEYESRLDEENNSLKGIKEFEAWDGIIE